MPLTSPAELKRFLDSLGVSPKKSLSQNFLIDGNILEKILDEAQISAGDYVFEIGAGPGALTEGLLARGAEVFAVEKDHTFAPALKRFEQIEVYEGDVLEFPLENLKRRGKVVSNLPYHLTTPILARLAPRRDLFVSITVMVQEEMARRMTAAPNSADYSSLTIFLNFYAEARYAFRVSRKCFYPVPKVDSAIVTLVLKEPPQIDEEKFFELVRTAFQQRRKQLKNPLSKLYPSQKIIEALEHLGKPVNVRPENLSLEDFLGLFRYLNS